ncbi:MAG: GCN5-related N-acetyltransferase, partial [Bryobacterales bacterium]|nr:GCN5-related N-acetyltransferase [Bryobacterales bacterium]
HSHMLGVAPEYRDFGIGRMLKLRQREEALSRSLDLMEWTFDPFELKNAYFNIERLGAIVRRYVLNQYGATSSHLHGGLPTDRCTAEWWLASARVDGAITGKPAPRPAVEERIALPAHIAEIRTREPKRARQIQSEMSDRFLEYFGRGLAVIGFEKSAEEGTYLLGKWE